MLDCSGLPCVDATLANGKHLRLLIDTGNVNSALDTTVATEAGLTVTPVDRADGKPAGYGRSVLPGVKLGEGFLGDLRALALELSDYVKRDRMPAADGSLAYTTSGSTGFSLYPLSAWCRRPGLSRRVFDVAMYRMPDVPVLHVGF